MSQRPSEPAPKLLTTGTGHAGTTFLVPLQPRPGFHAHDSTEPRGCGRDSVVQRLLPPPFASSRQHRVNLTRNMKKSVFKLLLTALCALGLTSLGFSQGFTTSALSGVVTDKQGKPIAGATVTVVHEESGTRATALTRANGQYDLSGLRVGGPYTITASAPGQPTETQKDVYLALDQAGNVNFALGADVVKLEAFNVSESSDTTFDIGKMGSSQSFNSSEIAALPTVRRDVQDLANLDTRIGLTENTSTGEFSVSAQGQNSRYNSFLIDGMQSNDPFGLNANGFSSLRSPIPLGALAALNIELSPYDATRTGFTGALINAVTKSGTNEFHGSAYTYYTGNSLRAKNPVTGLHDPLQEHTYGGTLGGPIIKDKLFFFVAYESYRKTAAAPGQNFLPDPTALATVAAAAKSYGYDIGTTNAGLSVSEQKTFLAKIDWNINQDNRLTLTYRRTDSNTPTFADYNGSTYTSASNHWYQSVRITDNYSLQINSQWTPDLRTDAGGAYIRYNGTAKPNGAPFPEIYINGVTGTNLATGAAVANGQLDLGTNYSYQLNALNTNDANGHLYGEYSWCDHTFKVGADADKTSYLDKFVQYYYGRYAFASPAAFAAGNANYLRYQQPSPGFTIPESFADYSLTDLGLLMQDTWKPLTGLTLVGGLRYDVPYIPGKPPYLPSFAAAFGIPNNTTGSGNYTLAPRFGFSYRLPAESPLKGLFGGRKTQIRGGIGLFVGTNPAVWVANAFDTAGALNAVQLGSATNSTTAATVATFNPNPNYVQTLPPPGAPTPNIDVIDPSYRTPVSWKSNLAIDHSLPWFGLIATAEANYIAVDKAIYLQSLNIAPVGTLPDGRIRYSGALHSNFATSGVIDMLNTNKGGSQTYSVSLARPMKDHWAFSLGYSHNHATEVQPLTSSVATSSYNYRATFNPNENVARTSAYEIPNKVVGTITRQFNFFSGADTATRISGVFRAQTGHAYSWVFSGDVNGDGVSGNDSFYVPTGPDDPKVAWADATQKANFFNFVNGTDLKKYMGSVVPANSSFNSMQKTLDLHIEQEIPLTHRARLTAFFDCLNFGNLINKNWGVATGLDFGTGYSGYNRSVASATYNAATNQYNYTFTSSTLASQINFTDLSRWQVQLGAQLQF